MGFDQHGYVTLPQLSYRTFPSPLKVPSWPLHSPDPPPKPNLWQQLI